MNVEQKLSCSLDDLIKNNNKNYHAGAKRSTGVKQNRHFGQRNINTFSHVNGAAKHIQRPLKSIPKNIYNPLRQRTKQRRPVRPIQFVQHWGGHVPAIMQNRGVLIPEKKRRFQRRTTKRSSYTKHSLSKRFSENNLLSWKKKRVAETLLGRNSNYISNNLKTPIVFKHKGLKRPVPGSYLLNREQFGFPISVRPIRSHTSLSRRMGNILQNGTFKKQSNSTIFSTSKAAVVLANRLNHAPATNAMPHAGRGNRGNNHLNYPVRETEPVNRQHMGHAIDLQGGPSVGQIRIVTEMSQVPAPLLAQNTQTFTRSAVDFPVHTSSSASDDVSRSVGFTQKRITLSDRFS